MSEMLPEHSQAPYQRQGMLTAINCPFCCARMSPQKVPGLEYRPGAATDEPWDIATCKSCRRPMLYQDGDPPTVYPQPVPNPTDPRVDAVVRATADEAKRALSVECWRAAAAMARRAVQAAVRQHGGVGKSLREEIESLRGTKLLPATADQAHAARWVGNDAAHPPTVTTNQRGELVLGDETVFKDDAREVVQLMDHILTSLYVFPSVAAALTEKHGK